ELKVKEIRLDDGQFTNNCKEGNPTWRVTTNESFYISQGHNKVELHLFSWEDFLPTFAIGDMTLYLTWTDFGIRCVMTGERIPSHEYLPANQEFFITFDIKKSTISVRSGSVELPLSSTTGSPSLDLTTLSSMGEFLLIHSIHN
ncbi:unnamed protein product, partial [Meganyctiphanes norvegica]